MSESNQYDRESLTLRLMAADPKTSKRKLTAIFLQSNDPLVLTYLAENSNCPNELLSRLSRHQATEVRIGVADNPKTELAIQENLVRDPDPDVRYSMAENHNLPQSIISTLLQDENPWVAKRARITLCNLNPDAACTELSFKNECLKLITVIVAEDNEFIRSMLNRVLNRERDISIVAGTGCGEETITECSRLKPSLILMDISMPGMNGLKATEVIKKESPGTKIIMVTGSDRSEDITRAFQAGADAYFLKTTPFHELPKVVRIVNEAGTWLDPGISSTILKHCFERPENRKVGRIENAGLNLIREHIDALAGEQCLEDATLLARACVKLTERIYGIGSQEMLEAMAKLGDLHYASGEYKSSETILLKAIESHEPLLNRADENTDYVLSHLGKAEEDEGRFQQAELYYTWSLRIRERFGDKAKIEEARNTLDSIKMKTRSNAKEY